MKTTFRSSFIRDLKKIKDRSVLQKVREVIEEVEGAVDRQSIGNLKKISGGDSFYRIRIGDYRVGIVIETNEAEFVRCLHRRDIYRFFP